MACKGCTCSTSKSGDAVAGCGSNGCSSGGCNRMNTFDWLTALDIEDTNQFDVVEISFKNGSRKEFFKNPPASRATTGDMVLVEADNGGYDVGRISLSGELVRIQMKKRGVKEKTILPAVIRKANERDLERLQEAREAEKPTMVKARVIARSLNLDMKIGDVEYQGDKRKATFFYTADGRVDFRELIREYAKEFKVKIEMRQIGARQESARIGGLGPCGRELCCSTWLTDFKSVSTTAARYQNLAINQSKLSGQCGRLKCCLNYELDTYMDALEHFPAKADKIYTEEGAASLMKTDIFKGLMFYCYEKDHGRGKFYPLDIDQVKEVLEMNKVGQKPTDLSSIQIIEEEDEEVGFDGDLTGVVELPLERKKKKKKKKKPEIKREEPRKDKNKGTGNFIRKSDTPPSTETAQPKQADNQAINKQSQQKSNENRPPQREERKDNNKFRNDSSTKHKNENRPPKKEDNRSENDKQGQNNNRPQQPPKPKQDNRPPKKEERIENDKQGQPNNRPTQQTKPNEPRPPKPPHEKVVPPTPPTKPENNAGGGAGHPNNVEKKPFNKDKNFKHNKWKNKNKGNDGEKKTDNNNDKKE
jgi:cell fate regulator YaaT (PSP1 superfamily)/uncharacterized protein YihD (DUF1040 family)